MNVYELLDGKMNLIEDFINDIPNSYNRIEIMSDLRKEYYIKTLQIRIDKLLYPKYVDIKSK